MSGGAKSNMIADSADLHWSARLPPVSDSQAFLSHVMQLGGAREHADWIVPFLGPTLPVAGGDDEPVEMPESSDRPVYPT